MNYRCKDCRSAALTLWFPDAALVVICRDCGHGAGRIRAGETVTTGACSKCAGDLFCVVSPGAVTMRCGACGGDTAPVEH